jgi:hypothetical protein
MSIVFSAATLFAFFVSANPVHAATLQGLGDIVLYDVSADGTTVVGTDYSQAVRWTRAGGLSNFDNLPGNLFPTHAGSVSANGTVVVGGGQTSSGQVAFYWTPGTGTIPLQNLIGGSEGIAAVAISANSSTIIGSWPSTSGREAFRSTAAEGIVALGDIPGGALSTFATAVSDDGVVIAGNRMTASVPPGNPSFDAVRWTGGIATAIIPRTGLAADGSSALAISGDGTTIVGEVHSATGPHAFRWTETGGLDVLIDDRYSSATAASHDGSVIVGAVNDEVFIWTEARGARRLADVLEHDYGLDLGDWHFLEAVGISADGKTIVGNGNNGAWIVNIPEPSALTLSLMGCPATCALVGARRVRKLRNQEAI